LRTRASSRSERSVIARSSTVTRGTPEEIRARYQYFTEARIGRLRAAGFTRKMTSLEDGVTKYVRDYLDQADRYK